MNKNKLYVDYNDFNEVTVRQFGFVRWASINNKNVRLLCLRYHKEYNRFSHLTYDEFLTDLDKEFKLTNRSKVDLCKVNRTFMAQAVLYFLKDFKKKLDKVRTRATKKVKVEVLENLSEVPVPGVNLHQPFPTVKQTEAYIMLKQILDIIDEDERHLVLYKLGRISNQDLKEYLGGVSDTIISRRWKKLQAKLDHMFGGDM
tara:strand:- start:883 stop:1485 length:603 start_codon:yes stop_codon:yes gene_type:complete